MINKLRNMSLGCIAFAATATTAMAQNPDRDIYPKFDKSNDILIAQFDNRADADDVHSQAALGCMLLHEDFKGVNVYGVMGATGTQKAKIIDSSALFNAIYGPQGNNTWTDARSKNEHSHVISPEWTRSVERIKNKVLPILQSGGHVWVQEAGQSHLTADWIQALHAEGISKNLTRSNVHVVQHSSFNHGACRKSDMVFVRANSDYILIPDGNGNHDSEKGQDASHIEGYPRTINGSTDYETDDNELEAHKPLRQGASSSSNPNETIRNYWSLVEKITKGFNHGYSVIPDGGLDFSDCSENHWIFDLGPSLDSIPEFWSRYVLKVPSNDGASVYQEKDGLVIMEAENTKSKLNKWTKKTNIPDYTGNSFIEFTGNSHHNGPANSPLKYTFKITKPGHYTLALLAAKEHITINGKVRTDLANDCYVRVEGDYNAVSKKAPLELLKRDTKLFGGEDKSFRWASVLDLGSHNFTKPVYDFKAGETYTLVISGRSKAFKIDRILLRHSSVQKNIAQKRTNPESKLENSGPQTQVLGPNINAIDIVDLNSGPVPFSVDTSNSALQIAAGIESNRNKWARATFKSNLKAGLYDLTLTTMKERDGESPYRILINGQVVGASKNHTTNRDYALQDHTFKGINVPEGATVRVEAKAVTNGKIPEGNGTAYARGRWTQLVFTPAAIDQTPTINTKVLTEATVGELYNFTLKATGGDGALRWSLRNSQLPQGLQLISTSGKISGVPISQGAYNFKVQVKDADGDLKVRSLQLIVNEATSTLPEGKESTNIGSTNFNTTANYDNGTYSIDASGTDIWGNEDSFGFIHQSVTGDVELTAKIQSLDAEHIWAKAGVMIRETLDADSKHAMTVITPDSGVSFQRRVSTGSNSKHSTIPGIQAPEFVRVVRNDNLFTGYYSSSNNVWFPINSIEIDMATETQVGLAVTSHDDEAEASAVISNYRVRKAAQSLSVVRFILVNADTNEDIREVLHNSTIKLSQDGYNLNIRAEVSDKVQSVVFNVNEENPRTENSAPYSMSGDMQGAYNSWQAEIGTHTIMATPFSVTKGEGNTGSSLAVIIKVVE
ncbi:MAG: Ig domain-containing protein [Lentisphaeraceae bacterium]|nr:Ig domain-containing protein [Lentisphaeraceae bacterium]